MKKHHQINAVRKSTKSKAITSSTRKTENCDLDNMELLHPIYNRFALSRLNGSKYYDDTCSLFVPAEESPRTDDIIKIKLMNLGLNADPNTFYLFGNFRYEDGIPALTQQLKEIAEVMLDMGNQCNVRIPSAEEGKQFDFPDDITKLFSQRRGR